MLLKDKENLGFHTNQFTEAIFISSLQLFFFFFARKYFYEDLRYAHSINFLRTVAFLITVPLR